MKPYIPYLLTVALASSLSLASAVLVQPHNYLVDDSAMIEQPDGGSLSPFYSDQSGSTEHSADRDIIGIIGERLARLRWARMLDNVEESQLSPEMAELVSGEEQASAPESESVASMLLKAVSDQSAKDEQQASAASGSERSSPSVEQAVSAAPHKPTKTSSQWYNPMEVIPVLKISSMATPSKYKKVYFRSEKKLIDGAFHSPSSEQEQQQKNKKKSLLKPFGSGLQRRSSRGGGASSAAPPSPLQDGVVEFLRKFRDVYIQTRPVNTASGSSSLLSASASSPLASIFGASGSLGRPNSFANTLSAATSLVAQAAGTATSGSSASPAATSGSSSSPSGTSAGGSSSSSPLSAQSYVSFWSKTFPNWVRKTLKQLRRRSLHNSRRHQQQHQHHHSAIGQAAQAAASAVVEHATSGSSSSSSSGASSSSTSS